MIKLIPILEKIIKIPSSVLDKSKELYDYINQNMNELITKSPDNSSNPYIALQDYFDFPNPYAKKSLESYIIVDIGFYYNPNKTAIAAMSVKKMKGGDYLYTFIINLANIPEHYMDFRDTVEHELIHAIDPKVKLQLNKNHPDEIIPSNFHDYISSPKEFDTFTTTIIRTIKSNLDTIEYRDEYVRLLLKLLFELKNKSVEELTGKYRNLDFLFSRKQVSIIDFSDKLNQIKQWATNDALYKRFLQRLYNEIK
jgi:hypothetical protein